MTGVFLAPYFSVQRAVVPELVGEEQAEVAQAAALFQAANRTTIFLGPPLAGVLISLIGHRERVLRRRGDLPRVVPARRARSCDCRRSWPRAADRGTRRRAVHRARQAPAALDAGVHGDRHLLDAPLRVAAGAGRHELSREPADPRLALRRDGRRRARRRARVDARRPQGRGADARRGRVHARDGVAVDPRDPGAVGSGVHRRWRSQGSSRRS